MKKYLEEEWNNIFQNPPPPGSSGKILYTDEHTAQQTPNIKHCLYKYKTTLINVQKSYKLQPEEFNHLV